jgi:acetyl esterase/lipase
MNVRDLWPGTEMRHAPFTLQLDNKVNVPANVRLPPEAIGPFEPPFVLPENVQLIENVVFATPDGMPLRLQLFLPTHPVDLSTLGVVWIHGGGWRFASMQGRSLWRQAAHFAARGVPGVSITYRFTPNYRFPSQLEDVQAAVRWTRVHARLLGIDPNRIAAVGESAGGHLAALLGTTDSIVDGISSKVQAVVAAFGVFDFCTLHTDVGADAAGALHENNPHIMREASPMYRADATAAPTLLLHGTADTIAPFDQAARYHSRLLEFGVRAELIPGEGAGHGHIHGSHFEQSLRQMEEFVLHELGQQ